MTDEPASDLACADTLWKAADTLCRQVDAAEYKHVVLGLFFLKYISESLQSRRDELEAELTRDGITGKQLERLLESRDEYTAERGFQVPPESRWPRLQNQATRTDITTLIDLIAGIGLKGARDKARDTLGRVDDYFPGKFAAVERKLERIDHA